LFATAQADADACGELDWLVATDSSLMRVHQHGASARCIGGNAATAEGPVPEPAMGTGGTIELHELLGLIPVIERSWSNRPSTLSAVPGVA
jgi:hypothetical protein